MTTCTHHYILPRGISGDVCIQCTLCGHWKVQRYFNEEKRLLAHYRKKGAENTRKNGNHGGGRKKGYTPRVGT